MLFNSRKKEGTKGRTTLLVVLVLCANALIVGLMEQYHERQIVLSGEEHARLLAEIDAKNQETKADIITLEGVTTWEETLYATSTKQQ